MVCFSLSGRKTLLLSEFLLNACGWWWKTGGRGAAGSAQPQLTITAPHSSLSCRRHCMHVFKCLTFLCDENSTCSTSDMVDVSCPHYSLLILVWGASQIALSQTHMQYKKSPRRNEKDKCFTTCLSRGRYSDRLNCVTRRFQPSVRQLFGTSFPQPLKATRKLTQIFFLVIAP